MNVLPTSPENVKTSEDLDQYFRDLKRWNFEVAYNAFYAFPMKTTRKVYAPRYREFVRRAHDLGIPACVQIQSTIAHLDDVPISEAQYYADNTPHTYEHFPGHGRKFFFASFASVAWRGFLERLTHFFRECGFDWVVFEEPMVRVDVPGRRDRFYSIFSSRYPHAPYPTRQDETASYLLVQRCKREVLIDFYDALSRHAKTLGFEQVGIMPWFFAPTHENTPYESWNPCCDLGRLTHLKAMDFVVVRMQPDNVHAQAMIAATGESLPRLGYLEVLAHARGKPLIAVNNPTDEHRRFNDTSDTLLPYEFFARYTLSAFAAAPAGMTRHWYTKDYGRDERHMDLIARLNPFYGRLGRVAAPVAFVMSDEGMSHALPRPWREAWRTYWNFARPLLFNDGVPFLTLSAGTLAQTLKSLPQIRFIVLSEYFPISQDEVEFLRKWLAKSSSRRLIYFGSRNGYRHEHGTLYADFRNLPPEQVELFGLSSRVPLTTALNDAALRLDFAGSDPADAFLGATVVVPSEGGYARPRDASWLPGATTEILYRAADENKTPLIWRSRIEKRGEAIFVGLSLDGSGEVFPLSKFLRAAAGSKLRRPILADFSHGLLWNTTSNGYMVVSNPSPEPQSFKLRAGKWAWWDSRERKIVNSSAPQTMPALDFCVLRRLNHNDLFVDVEGALLLEKIVQKGRRLILRGRFAPMTRLWLRDAPKAIKVGAEGLTLDVVEDREVKCIEIHRVPRGSIEMEVDF